GQCHANQEQFQSHGMSPQNSTSTRTSASTVVLSSWPNGAFRPRRGERVLRRRRFMTVALRLRARPRARFLRDWLRGPSLGGRGATRRKAKRARSYVEAALGAGYTPAAVGRIASSARYGRRLRKRRNAVLRIFDAHVHLFDCKANRYAFLEREDPTFRTLVGD